MALDLTDVALFVRAAVTRNLSAAGREFGLSPAATSARLAQLEKHLNTRLFIRSTRQINLSQGGELFLPAAHELLAAAEAAQASVREEAQAQGVLRVAVSASFGRQHLAPLVAPFLQAYPHIRLDLRLSDTVADLVAEGIDVAIRLGALRDSSLVARKLAPNRRVLCATPAYLAKHGWPQKPQDLVRHQCLVLGGKRDWHFRARAEGSEVESVRVQGPLESDNYELLCSASLQDLGILINASWYATPYLRSGQLQGLLPDYRFAEDSFIWAVYPSRKYLPPKTQVFIDFLARHFTSEPYWDEDLNAEWR